MSSNMNIILPSMNNNWPLFHINGCRRNLQCANKQTSVHMHERVMLYFFAHIWTIGKADWSYLCRHGPATNEDHRSEAQTTHITCRFAMEVLIDKENPQRCSICDPAHSNLMMKSQNMPVWLSEMVFRPFWPSIFAYEAGTGHTNRMHLPKKSEINWIWLLLLVSDTCWTIYDLDGLLPGLSLDCLLLPYSLIRFGSKC
jgi:hypothetical protein